MKSLLNKCFITGLFFTATLQGCVTTEASLSGSTSFYGSSCCCNTYMQFKTAELAIDAVGLIFKTVSR